MKPKKVLAGLLAAFALVSIGFAVGKEVTLRRLRSAAPREAPAPPGAGDMVVLYYMHPTFRCVTCNQMEKTILDLVKAEFAAPLARGRLRWQDVNFDQDEALARRYNVAASSLVVVEVRGGRETGHQTLDAIWPLLDKPDELKALVRGAIRSRLEEPAP